MENLKNFMTSPKKTAVLGLIGSIIILAISLIHLILNNAISIFYLSQNIFKLGMLIYFLLITMRLYNGTGNVKFANIILLATLILNIVVMSYIRNVITIITGIVYLVMVLYFIRILFNKNTFVNNIMFLIAVVTYSIMGIITYSPLLLKIMYLAYILIIPYFYGYFELLKEER